MKTEFSIFINYLLQKEINGKWKLSLWLVKSIVKFEKNSGNHAFGSRHLISDSGIKTLERRKKLMINEMQKSVKILTLPSMIVGKRNDFWNLTFVISDFYSMNMWVAWIVGLTEAIRQNFIFTVPLTISWNSGKWQVSSIANCS